MTIECCFFAGRVRLAVSPLAFGEEEMSSLVALDKYQKRDEVFDRMREAINSTTFSGRFSMLASALEAIAGQKTLPKGRLTTDRDYIANEVLQDEELCRSIFGYGGGIRNQLLHGIEINLDQHGGVDYVTRIYDSIVRYFNQKHGTQIETHVKDPMRTPEGNYQRWQGWLLPKEDKVPLDLKSLCDSFSSSQDGCSSALAYPVNAHDRYM